MPDHVVRSRNSLVSLSWGLLGKICREWSLGKPVQGRRSGAGSRSISAASESAPRAAPQPDPCPFQVEVGSGWAKLERTKVATTARADVVPG